MAARLGRGTKPVAGYVLARGVCRSSSGEHAIQRERRRQHPSSAQVWCSLRTPQTKAELASAPPPPAASLERARLVLQQQHNQYNELVLAADTLNSLLPGTIEAVYMLPHT